MTRKPLKNNVPWILGIGASHHNAAVCLLTGSKIHVAIQEERLTGIKRRGFSAANSINAIPYCLDAAGIKAKDLDLVVVSTAGYSAGHIENDITLNRQLRVISNDIPYSYIPHHLAHAASVYALSGLSHAAVLVIDGLGSPFNDLTDNERRASVDHYPIGWEHASLYHARGRSIECLEKHLTPDRHWLKHGEHGMPSFYSFGAMYSAVASQIFGNPLEAGKVMGLAPYGRVTYHPEEFYRKQGRGFVFLDSIPRTIQYSERWPSNQEAFENLAASVQMALQEAVLELATRLKRYTEEDCLCYSGGVALNCTTNELLYRSGLFSDIFMIPAAEDSGVAIGAAYYGLWNLMGEHDRTERSCRDGLGTTYWNVDIHALVEANSGAFAVTRLEEEEFLDEVASRLAIGGICGWYDGASELGPRALGRRSILADPRTLGTKAKVNDEIKGRESFRPLAPMVLEEAVEDWFQFEGSKVSPFMLRTWEVIESKASLIPAVVHVDGTARVQTVNQSTEPRLHNLLKRFERMTGIPILLNTSFNAAGEPIVETPVDALWSFVGLGLDCLAINNCIVVLKPEWSSLLDFVPYVSAEVIQTHLPIIQGRLGQTPASDELLLARTSRQAGSGTHSLSLRESAVVRLIDGKSNGKRLLERVENEYSDLDEKSLRRTLISLRRVGAISFR